MNENNTAAPANSAAPAQQSTSLQPGTLLVSQKRNYKVVAELGAGGYGVTYLAKGKIKVDNVWVEGFFAIKEFFPCEFSRRVGQAIVPDPNHLDEFNRCKSDFLLEASRLQNVATNHPNIVRVNEIFEANGTAYYVMQHINGQSLYDYVGQYGALQLNYSLQLLLPVFDAIEYLHGNRINHFDIKPDNIMLQQADEGIIPILIDFGLSIHFRKDNEKTTQKAFYGLSEGYAPVEQYAEIKAFSPASDVYSLAATLVYMLTGTAPAPAPALKVADLRAQLQPILPPQVVDAICHAMAKQDEMRTPSVAQFRAELLGQPVAAPAPAPAPAAQAEKPQPQPDATEPKRMNTVLFDDATRVKPQAQQQAPKPRKTEMFTGGPKSTPTVQQPGPGQQAATVPQGFPAGQPQYPAPGRQKPAAKKGGFPVVPVILGVVILALIGAGVWWWLNRTPSSDVAEEETTEEVVVEEENASEGSGEKISAQDVLNALSTPAEEPAAEAAAPAQDAPAQGAASTGSAAAAPAKPSGAKQTTGSCSMGNGTYSGGLLGGKPNGKGTVRYTAEGPVASNTSETALPGYRLEGTYENGVLTFGKLYDAEGKLIKTIIP